MTDSRRDTRPDSHRDAHPRRQLYGRRKGHALSPRQAALIAELLPALRIDLSRPLPKLARATWLEIGFGGGEHLAHQAALHPDALFLGAEPFVNGVAKLLASIEAKGLDNVRVHDGDARDLMAALPARSLDRIDLLYPDPWPKARHHKRRFVNPQTLAQFHRLLKPDGLFLFASDVPDYVDWTRALVRSHGGFAAGADDAATPPDHWLRTRYEAKAARAGRVPAYLRFRRAARSVE